MFIVLSLDKIHKNENVNVTKRARFATFALSIVDNFAALNETKSKDDCHD